MRGNLRDKSRFDKLHVKLFLAIAGAIAALTFAAYYVFTASFERGFMQYLNRADEVRLDSMIDRLAAEYARERSWSWIVNDRQRWIDMSRDALGLAGPPEQTKGPVQERALLRRDTPLTIDPRLMLFDRNRKQLIGRPEVVPLAVFKPISLEGDTVGY